MKILEYNRERLRIRHVPWIAGGVTFLLGALGILDVLIDIDDDLGVGGRLLTALVSAGILWLGWWFLPSVDLTLDRPNGAVVLAERRITGTHELHLTLSDIHAARVQTDRYSQARLSRLVLESQTGSVPVERTFGPMGRDAIAQAINAWIADRG